MSFICLLILAICAQLAAAVQALRMNWKYGWNTAWTFISGAAAVMSLAEFALLNMVFDAQADLIGALPLFTVCISVLLVSIFFVGGVFLIEPLLRENQQAQEILTDEKRRLQVIVQTNEEELATAQAIQQRLLPAAAPKLGGFDIAGASHPAEWTSGDFFDFVPLPNNHVGIVIADVSGHGTGPALLMTTTRALIRGLAHVYDDIAMILSVTNNEVIRDVQSGRFVTAFFVNLDPINRQFTYASAGHNGMLLKSCGEVEMLEFGGPPLGAARDYRFQDAPPQKLNPGDALILVTDGIFESEDDAGEMFGRTKMMDVIRECHGLPASDMVETLYDSARAFSHHRPQHDDMSAVAIRVLEPVPDQPSRLPVGTGSSVRSGPLQS